MQVPTKKILGVLGITFVVYTIIATPDKASELVAQWFTAISNAARWTGSQINSLAGG